MQLCQVSAYKKKNFDFFPENLPFISSRQPIKSSNLDKSRMKYGELFNKHFWKKLAEIVNFHFSHYKSMETLSCHSNQSSYLTEIKKKTFVKGNVLSKYTKFRLHLLNGFRGEYF